jgi:membrane protease YdiL (CAAX protease family)
VVEGGLALLAVVLAWLLGIPLAEHLRGAVAGLAQGLLATLPLAVGLLLLDRWPLGGFRHLKELMRDSILPLFRECSLEALLLISMAAGVGEELLFRGVAQLGIEQASGSTWLAVAVASVLFGLAHPITKTYALLAGLIGVYFGVLLVLTSNLLVPIVAHVAYDFIALVYLLRRQELYDHSP